MAGPFLVAGLGGSSASPSWRCPSPAHPCGLMRSPILAVRIVMHVNKPFFVRKVAGHVRLVGQVMAVRSSRAGRSPAGRRAHANASRPGSGMSGAYNHRRMHIPRDSCGGGGRPYNRRQIGARDDWNLDTANYRYSHCPRRRSAWKHVRFAESPLYLSAFGSGVGSSMTRGFRRMAPSHARRAMYLTARSPTAHGSHSHIGGHARASQNSIVHQRGAALGQPVAGWDGRAASLEEQSLLPVANPTEMGSRPPAWSAL